MFEFIVFVVCSFFGWCIWYRNYRARMRILRQKYLTDVKVTYTPGGATPWHIERGRFLTPYYFYAGCDTKMGKNWKLNQIARQFEKEERWRVEGEL